MGLLTSAKPIFSLVVWDFDGISITFWSISITFLDKCKFLMYDSAYSATKVLHITQQTFCILRN
jgi:hypothetical protein